jgi:hypothetical protein
MIASRYLAACAFAALWLGGCGGDAAADGSSPVEPSDGSGGSSIATGVGGDSSTGGSPGAGGSTYVYTNFQPNPEHGRALLTDDTTWDRMYTAATTATGGNPFGTAVSYSSLVGKYVIVMSSESGMWRYIEP